MPETVRRALKLGKRDKIHYTIRPGGVVLLTRADTPEALDPVLGQFLSFLASDMVAHPERLQGIDAAFIRRIQSVVSGIEVDLDSPLSEADE